MYLGVEVSGIGGIGRIGVEVSGIGGIGRIGKVGGIKESIVIRRGIMGQTYIGRSCNIGMS